ncbi:MAG: DUF4262 domain-containing protein [Bacteroidetes bacterium]|nr:DUF4262 domain-containing protein [Bacteroidota bacterium]
MTEHSDPNCIGKNELLLQTKKNIGIYGLQVVMVNGTDYLPPFAYSIGLRETYQHPEVICFGLPHDLSHAIINDVASIIKTGKRFAPGAAYADIFKNSHMAFLVVDDRNIKDYFGGALNYYGERSFSALQLIWTDRNDKFPWEESFEKEFLYRQPLLDRNVDFKFYEPRNLHTFTTKQWLDHGQPILRVVHDHDGDWQFLTGDQMPGDISIVALEQMIKGDPTLNELWHLDYGRAADRTHIGGAWTITEVEEEIEEDIEE